MKPSLIKWTDDTGPREMSAGPQFPQGVRAAKLSKLQKQILLLALANKQREVQGFDEKRSADLYYAEILAAAYGFPPRETPFEPRAPRGSKLNLDSKAHGPGACNAACAAVSRALMRLEERGLTIRVLPQRCGWVGCDLTLLGVDAAKRLRH